MKSDKYKKYLDDWYDSLKLKLYDEKYKEYSSFFYVLNKEFFTSPQRNKKYNQYIIKSYNGKYIVDEEKEFYILNEDTWKKIKYDFPYEMELKVKGAIEHNKCYFIINEFIYYFYFINKDNEFEEGYFQFQEYSYGSKIISLFNEFDIYKFFKKLKISDSNTVQKIYYEGQYFFIKRKRVYNRQNNFNINDNFNRNNKNINNHIENNNNLNHHHHRQNHENNNNKNKMHDDQNNQRHNPNLNDIHNHNFGNNNNDKKDKWNNNKNNNNINMNNINNNNLNHNMNNNNMINNLINDMNMMNINNMKKNNIINNNIINNINNQKNANNNLFNQRNNNFKKNENNLNNGNIFGFNQNNNNNRNNSPLLNNYLNNFNNNNQNKKLNKRTKSANIFEVNKFLSPSTKGLVNVGATCYMNATIQCLAHVSKLTKYLLNLKYINNNISDKNKYKLTNSYIEVLNNIWLNYNINYYSPDNFKNIISIMNPLFAGVQANDSKDLVLFMLETIHNELNKPNNNNQINGIQKQNQYDYETTFNLFKNYFTKNYNSIISNLFYGMYNSMMTCLNCNATTHNVQCFNILIFPLEEVRKYKNKLNNTVDIIECFEYYQKKDIMKDSNQIYCNNCKAMSNCNNKTQLIIGPNVLVINLNRGKGLEFNVKINFEEYLDIKNFIYYKEESPSFYELIGIVTHFGPSSMSGHFIAFCKSFVDNQWYKYNDTQVNLSSFQEARSTGVPYILFYSFIKR